MRVKQTARKSTAQPSHSRSGGPRPGNHSLRSSANGTLNNDPVRNSINNLLQTKKNHQRAIKHEGKNISVNSQGKRDLVKIKPRAKPGELALSEIRRLQKTYDLQIPRAPFHRLVREITQDILPNGGGANLRYQTAALVALQEATESFLVQLYEDSYLCTLHAKRVTLFVSDMHLCQRLQRIRGLY